MSFTHLLFHLPVAQQWEARLQVTYLAPARPSDPNLPVDVEQVPRLRTNIVVSRTSTEETDPGTEWRNFITQTAKAMPGLDLVSDADPCTFDDGVRGVIGAVNFPATEQVRLTQLHAFRIDNGVLTQLVATMDEVEANLEREQLRQMLLDFRPEVSIMSSQS